MIRNTYALIDENILRDNIKEIKSKYPDYKYYFGVVKNNAYHHGMHVVNALIDGGINYLCVSSLEEALAIRKYNKDISILVLELINLDYINLAIDNNITITIDSLEYAKNIKINKKIKVHIAIDSGMNRIGINNKKELNDTYKLLISNKNILLEGIYSHFATSGVRDVYYDSQVNKFKDITSDIDLNKIPIGHIGRSLSLVQHDKLDFCNGIRLGIIMYGFAQSSTIDNSLRGKLRIKKREYLQKKYNISKTYLTNDLKLKTAFKLYTSVMSVRKVKINDVVGYNTYKVLEDGYILTLPIGYADGVTKDYKYVYINSKRYEIVSDCMDMIMVFSKDKIKINTKVEIFGDNISVRDVCNRLHINAYHLFNLISDRVLRLHIYNDNEEEILY